MRGTFFLAGTEIIVTTEGESWFQGDSLRTSWEVKADPTKHENFCFGLYTCDLRKLKKKDPKCLSPVEASNLGSLQSPGVHAKEFALSKASPISDGSTGLCLFVGPESDPASGGILQLDIKPWSPITEMLSLFENFERFKIKGLKNKKNSLSCTLIPPGSKELGNVEGLTLTIDRKEDDGLKLNFEFKIKKLTYEAGTVQTKAEKVSIKKELTKKELLSFGDAINQDFLLNFFKEVLSEIPRGAP